jgi:hypothetical protein
MPLTDATINCVSKEKVKRQKAKGVSFFPFNFLLFPSESFLPRTAVGVLAQLWTGMVISYPVTAVAGTPPDTTYPVIAGVRASHRFPRLPVPPQPTENLYLTQAGKWLDMMNRQKQ